MSKCLLCKSDCKDVLLLGEFINKCGISVHTYCLYLTSNLYQRGNENEGLFGFLPEDIRAEAKRISLLNCCYCGKSHPSVGCCHKKCRVVFHVSCGMRHDVENQFLGTFQSFCHRHVHKTGPIPQYNEQCCICYDDLMSPGERFNVVKMLQAKCCHNGWFHKLCLQKFANAAGYFFKCPLCNNENIFRKTLQERGVFIPDIDAAWELEPNAYADQLVRPDACCVEYCNSDSIRSNNPLIICNTCGSMAIHKYCMTTRGTIFKCPDCILTGSTGSEQISGKFKKEETEIDFSCSSSDVDVCNVSIASEKLTVNGHSDLLDETEKDNINSRLSHSEDDVIIRPKKKIMTGAPYRFESSSNDESDDDTIVQPVKRFKRKIFESSDDENIFENGRKRLKQKRVSRISSDSHNTSESSGITSSLRRLDHKPGYSLRHRQSQENHQIKTNHQNLRNMSVATDDVEFAGKAETSQVRITSANKIDRNIRSVQELRSSLKNRLRIKLKRRDTFVQKSITCFLTRTSK